MHSCWQSFGLWSTALGDCLGSPLETWSITGTLVSRAPVLLAVSMGQSSLVSCLPAASGAVSCPEALVSRSPAFSAATMRSVPLAGDAFILLFSIPLYCCVPITLQACLCSFLPLNT